MKTSLQYVRHMYQPPINMYKSLTTGIKIVYNKYENDK